jgi:hypothetical protein
MNFEHSKIIDGIEHYYFKDGKLMHIWPKEVNNRNSGMDIWFHHNGTRNAIIQWKNNEYLGPEIIFNYKSK